MRLLFLGCLPICLALVGCSGSNGKLTCTADAECLDGYVCDSQQPRICLRGCTAASTNDCLDAQYCDVPAGATKGVCRDGSAVTPPSDVDSEPGGDAPAAD